MEEGQDTVGVTSYDVAREAGVNQSTVSLALRGDPRVAEQTRARIVEVAQRLGYVPNTLARNLRAARTHTVGAVVEDVANPFYAELLKALYAEFAKKGYRIILFEESPDLGSGKELVSLLVGKALDGAIFTTGTLKAPAVEMLAERNLPLVLLNRYVDGIDTDMVTSDNVGGGHQAARHLVELGHHRIGLITGPENTSTSRDRELGLRTGLQKDKLSLPEDLRRVGSYSHESGYQLCRELLEQENPPTAIFCTNDVIAQGAFNAAIRAGVEVPQELSIVGFDDLEMAGWEAFQLTTVGQPIQEMAESAVRILIDRIEHKYTGPSRSEVLPTNLIERNTTAPPAQLHSSA